MMGDRPVNEHLIGAAPLSRWAWWSLAVGGGGIVAGLLMLFVGWVFEWIEKTAGIQAEYQNNTAFRDWPGWSATYMVVHPLWFGFVYALVFTLLHCNQPVGMCQSHCIRSKGWCAGKSICYHQCGCFA
jgi:hypothetical protein